MSDTTNEREVLVRCQQCSFTRSMNANCAPGNFTDFCESCGRLTIHLLSEAVPLEEHKRALAFHLETMAERNRLLDERADLKTLLDLDNLSYEPNLVVAVRERLAIARAEITRLTGQLADAERASAEHFKDCLELSKVVEEAREHYTAMAIVAYEEQPTEGDYFRAQRAHDRLHAALKEINEP